MLLGFRVANALSFRDEQQLSFVATELNDGSGRPTGIHERGKEILAVPVLALYGANASGKTNVLAALRLMRAAVLGSLRWFSEPDPVRRVAFALDPTLRAAPSFYEVEIVLADGVRYTYGFEIDDDRVTGEWLHAYRKAVNRSGSTAQTARLTFPARDYAERSWNWLAGHGRTHCSSALPRSSITNSSCRYSTGSVAICG